MRRPPTSTLSVIVLACVLSACTGPAYLKPLDAYQVREVRIEVAAATTAATLDSVATGKASGALEGAGRASSKMYELCGALTLGGTGGTGLLCLALLPLTLTGGAIYGALKSENEATVSIQLQALQVRLQQFDVMSMLRDSLLMESRRIGAADLFSEQPASPDFPALTISQYGFLLDGEELGLQEFRVYPVVVASLSLPGQARPARTQKYAGKWQPRPFVEQRLQSDSHNLDKWASMNDTEFRDAMTRVVGDYAVAIIWDFLEPWRAAIEVVAPLSRPSNAPWYKSIEASERPDLVWKAAALADAGAPVEYDVRIVEVDPAQWQYIDSAPRNVLYRQFLDAQAIYERNGIRDIHHSVEMTLAPCKTFLWAVRARGGGRTTAWQFLRQDHSHVTTFGTACPQ